LAETRARGRAGRARTPPRTAELDRTAAMAGADGLRRGGEGCA
jgi:hypothetical protein